MAYGSPLAPPPYTDDPSMYDALGIAPPPSMQTTPIGPQGPEIGLAPPPSAMPPPTMGMTPEETRAPAPVPAPPPAELAPPPPGVDAMSGPGLAPAPHSPDTIPAGPMGGHNAPQGPVDPEADLISQEADLASQQQEAEAAGLQQAAQMHTDRIQMGRLMQVRDEKVLDDAMKDVQAAQDEAKAMRVDPNQWWGSRTEGQKLALIIGAGISGFLSVSTGRDSGFMDQINQFIQNNIRGQQANIANARDSAQAKQSLYGMMYQKFQNARVAYDMTTAQMLDAAKDQIAAYSAQFKSPYTQLEGRKAILQIEQQQQAAIARAAHDRGEDMLKLVKAQDEHAKSVAETRKLNAETGKIGREGRDGGEKAVPVMVHGPQGSRQVVLPPEQAKLVQEAQKEQDAADKEQSEHVKPKSDSAEYKTWVARQEDRRRRMEATLRAAGVADDVILGLGFGFTTGGVGGNEQNAPKMTLQEQQTYFQGGPPSERGLIDFNGGRQNVPGGPAPAGIPKGGIP